MKLDPYLMLFTKINSKWIKNLNIKSKAIKLLEENIGENLLDFALGNDFLRTPKAKEAKNKYQQVGLHQTKKLCTVKETNNKMKR